MRSAKGNHDRQRETTRRAATRESVFLPALAGAAEGGDRVVVRNDIYLQALEAARRVLRSYYSERRRQL